MQGEKETLIDSGRLSGSLRGRNVTMVAARNVFKMHGARMVKSESKQESIFLFHFSY